MAVSRQKILLGGVQILALSAQAGQPSHGPQERTVGPLLPTKGITLLNVFSYFLNIIAGVYYLVAINSRNT